MVSVYGTNKLNFSTKMKQALGVEPPCQLVLEYNEDGEIVIRANEMKNMRG